jgi:hypothetical protein
LVPAGDPCASDDIACSQVDIFLRSTRDWAVAASREGRMASGAYGVVDCGGRWVLMAHEESVQKLQAGTRRLVDARCHLPMRSRVSRDEEQGGLADVEADAGERNWPRRLERPVTHFEVEMHKVAVKTGTLHPPLT